LGSISLEDLGAVKNKFSKSKVFEKNNFFSFAIFLETPFWSEFLLYNKILTMPQKCHHIAILSAITNGWWQL